MIRRRQISSGAALIDSPLEDLQRRARYAEGVDLFVRAVRVIFGEGFDVGGVVEVTGALETHVGGQVLAEALKARAARCCDVGLPVGACQPWPGTYRDPAVYDGDEVRVCNVVQ